MAENNKKSKIEDEASEDIKANGLWATGFSEYFFIKVINTLAKASTNLSYPSKYEIIAPLIYHQRIDVEFNSFIAMYFVWVSVCCDENDAAISGEDPRGNQRELRRDYKSHTNKAKFRFITKLFLDV